MIHFTSSFQRSSQRFLSTVAIQKFGGGYLQVSEEVQEALTTRKAVVALESTIITHGMPYPHNLSTALSVEGKVRDNGAVPATVAVLNGRICVGLTDADLQTLAINSSTLVKVSRRDLPYVLSKGLSGGTTVSATMIAAHMAGIPIFATGGIGGVHRGAETSFDISADLTELGRTPVAVVSSGVKSILDIPKTLEYLETQGVCVVSFGEKNNFPAFFTKDSGYFAPYNASTSSEAAEMIDAQLKVGLNSGMLIAVPIPDEFTATGEIIQQAINEAVESAGRNNIVGKEVTPYILDKVNKLTKGESLKANIALVENNASVAGSIASHLAQIREGGPKSKSFHSSVQTASVLNSGHTSSVTSKDGSGTDSQKSSYTFPGRPVVIGATIIDFSVQVGDPDLQFNGATYDGKVSQSFGGVGRNLADCLSRLNCRPVFVSAVGTDNFSSAVWQHCSHIDMQTVQKLDKMATATYCPVLLASGQLLFGVGNMNINSHFDISKISDLDLLIKSAPVVVIDGNFSSEVIRQVVQKCVDSSVPVWFEPTDMFKSVKPFETDAWKHLSFISPNMNELVSMHSALMKKLGENQSYDTSLADDAELKDIIKVSVQMCRDLVPHIPVVLVTLGKHGLLLCHQFGDASRLLPLPATTKHHKDIKFKAVYYRALNVELSKIVSVSGAGDCFASAFIAGMLEKLDLDLCVKRGLLAASISLQSTSAVPETISTQTVTTANVSHIFTNWQPVDVSNGQSEFL